jgi:hypothetical protein
MIGRVYVWKGETWMVNARWSGRGPRNVEIERVVHFTGRLWVRTGEKVVRPFRGLRRLP